MLDWVAYAFSENFGSDDDYLLEYEAGTLSNDAKTLTRIFGWKVNEVESALNKLAERGEVSLGQQVKGVKGEVAVVTSMSS